jgi:protein LTV1
MGKNKKPFIDKKNASTYHLLYRSQRDVGGDDYDNDHNNNNDGGTSNQSPGVVLWPSPNNNKETDQKVLLGRNAATKLEDAALSSWKQDLAKAGFVDDFDYDKHTKPISGTGQYYAAMSVKSGNAAKQLGAMVDARSRNVQDEIVKEVDRQLDSIALTADCMDDDIAQALFGDFDEADFEELNDDFVLDAAKEPDGDDGATFDFASHIQSLMNKAKMESDIAGGGEMSTIHEQGRHDQDFFSRARPLGDTRNENDDDESGYFDEDDDDQFEFEGTPGVVPKLSEADEQALCDKFNATLAEYDSDELGEGCDDDDVYGTRSLEGDAIVEAALDDFIKEKKDDIFMQGIRHYMEGKNHGGSGFSALVGTKMVPVKLIVEPSPGEGNVGIRPITDLLGEADQTLRDPLDAPPPEEIFIDGKSYFSEKMRNPWDCESILSTYSNLDNNPVTIGATGRRRRRQPKKNGTSSSISEHDAAPSSRQIILSEKTGLPLGVLPDRGGDNGDDDDSVDGDMDGTYMSVNRGESRRKDESAEEKKLRKLQVKKDRQLARMQKKMMKEAFNDEFSKRQHDVLVDDVGGKSVFRF